MRTWWGEKRDGRGITGLPPFHDSLRTSVASRTSNRERVFRTFPSQSLDTLCCISFYRVSLSNSDIVNLVPSRFQLFLTDGLETRSLVRSVFECNWPRFSVMVYDVSSRRNNVCEQICEP